MVTGQYLSTFFEIRAKSENLSEIKKLLTRTETRKAFNHKDVYKGSKNIFIQPGIVLSQIKFKKP